MVLDSEYYLNNPYNVVFSQIELILPRYKLRGSTGNVKVAVINQFYPLQGKEILSQYTEEELRKYWDAFLQMNRYSVVNVERKKAGSKDSVYLKKVMGRKILGSDLMLDVIVYVAQLWENGIGIIPHLFILSDEFKEIPEDERARREVEFIENDGKIPLF